MSDDEEVRMTLRIPAWLRDDLSDLATGHGRSMNAQIVEILTNHDTVKFTTEAKDVVDGLNRLTRTELGERILEILSAGQPGLGLSPAQEAALASASEDAKLSPVDMMRSLTVDWLNANGYLGEDEQASIRVRLSPRGSATDKTRKFPKDDKK